MEVLIKKLKEEVQTLKTKLANGGQITITNERSGSRSPEASKIGGGLKHSKIQKKNLEELEQEKENLNEQLFEL